MKKIMTLNYPHIVIAKAVATLKHGLHYALVHAIKSIDVPCLLIGQILDRKLEILKIMRLHVTHLLD